MKKHIGILILCSAVLVIGLLFLNTKTLDAKAVSKIDPPLFQKGMCYATWSENGYASKRSDESLASMSSVGVNCVAIVVTWYQDDIDSTTIKEVENRTPSDQSVIHAIRTAHDNGIAVMLKPHIDLIKDEGNCRADIGFSDDSDWARWFDSYKKFITRYARMAAEEGVEFFCVGTELSYAATRVDEWSNDIIPAVRKIYQGKITYAANWDNYKNIGFWGLLDFAGIDAYFPLTDKDTPQLCDLKDSWNRWVAEMEEWQKTMNKPVVFTECGYCSADTAAKRPWEEVFTDNPNLQLQADCYRALLETFCGKSWFAGLYWWSWNTYAGSGGPNHSRFTPQNKPALVAVKDWYTRDISGGSIF